MPFNADTYHADMKARQAWQYLADARRIRDMIKSGNPVYAGEASRVGTLVELARLFMHLSIGYRRLSRR